MPSKAYTWTISRIFFFFFPRRARYVPRQQLTHPGDLKNRARQVHHPRVSVSDRRTSKPGDGHILTIETRSNSAPRKTALSGHARSASTARFSRPPCTPPCARSRRHPLSPVREPSKTIVRGSLQRRGGHSRHGHSLFIPTERARGRPIITLPSDSNARADDLSTRCAA